MLVRSYELAERKEQSYFGMDYSRVSIFRLLSGNKYKEKESTRVRGGTRVTLKETRAKAMRTHARIHTRTSRYTTRIIINYLLKVHGTGIRH